MKYAVVTFGCRVNQADSLELESDLLARGATNAPLDEADLVVVNTCSVTASADQGARQTIRRLARANPSARIVVTGCYATRAPEDVARLPGVVRVVKNTDKRRLILLAAAELGLDSARRYGDGEGSCGLALEPGVAGRTAFTLRVQSGCRQPCAYCIIPSTRGVPRSEPVADVLATLRQAVDQGFKEVVLTGVHLGSYGRDLNPATTLAVLLERIARAAPPDLRVRISSLEPMDCPEAVVDVVAGGRVFAPHFHLPLQHASDAVLTRMRRGYTLSAFADLVDGVRRRLPDASIGTDLIVGFPGEAEEDIECLVTYLEGSPLTHAHVFPYSDRPGTAASVMEGKVEGQLISERAHRVRQTASVLTRRFHAAQVGRVHRSLTLDDGTVALTGNYLKVHIPPGCERNQWRDVRVLRAGERLSGEVVGMAALT